VVLFFYSEKVTGQNPHHSKHLQIAYHFVLPWAFVYTLQTVKCVKLNDMSTKQLPMCQSINHSFIQYRKCLHNDVASTVQIITVHEIQNSKQLL